MKKRQPWMKWYPSDWRADPALGMCGPAARGIWMDMIGLMHEAEPYGHLVVAGRVPTDAQLASLCRTDLRALNAALAELERAGVFSRDAEGRIFCRRMLRDKAKAEKDYENGKGGGNPTLRGKVARADMRGVNPPVDQADNDNANGADKAQKPEARSPSSLRSDGAAGAARRAGAADTPAGVPTPPQGADSLAGASPHAADTPAGDRHARTLDARAALFGDGLARLRRLTGRAEAPSRAMLGRWLRPLGDDCARLSAILAEAESLRPADPAAWIEAAVGNRAGAPAPGRRSAVAEAMSRLGLGELDLRQPAREIIGEAEEVAAC